MVIFGVAWALRSGRPIPRQAAIHLANVPSGIPVSPARKNIAVQTEQFSLHDFRVENLVVFLKPSDGCHDARRLQTRRRGGKKKARAAGAPVCDRPKLLDLRLVLIVAFVLPIADFLAR